MILINHRTNLLFSTASAVTPCSFILPFLQTSHSLSTQSISLFLPFILRWGCSPTAEDWCTKVTHQCQLVSQQTMSPNHGLPQHHVAMPSPLSGVTALSLGSPLIKLSFVSQASLSVPFFFLNISVPCILAFPLHSKLSSHSTLRNFSHCENLTIIHAN